MESKRDETFRNDLFGTNANLETWSGSHAITEAAMRVPSAPPIGGHAPYPRGPLGHPPTYFFLLYIPMYPKNIRSDHKNLIPVTFYIRDIPSWSLRRPSVGRGIDHGGPLHHLQGPSYEL